MAAEFPDILRPTTRSHDYEHKQQKRKFEDGRVSSRKVFTSGMWVWRLSWAYLPRADWTALKEHFDTYLGSVFYCSESMLDTPNGYNVRYSEDSLKAKSTQVKDHFSVAVTLEEAL